jgi:membrane protease YdiL (CAAX protease family)
MLPDPAQSLEPPEPALPSVPSQPPAIARTVAFMEVVICSDYPTQLALSGLFMALGYSATNPDKTLNIGFIVTLSLIDAVLLVGLMLAFLRAHGESPRQVFFGRRPVMDEAVHGLPLIVAAIFIGVAVLMTIQVVAPSLHTVANNPLRDLIRSPRSALLFALVVVVAGGIREEIQRAFLLHRFEVFLGGSTVGIVVASAAFGAGHLLQGADAAITTGLLGAFWGVVYLRRRSVIAPMVSHAGFDLVQILLFLSAP